MGHSGKSAGQGVCALECSADIMPKKIPFVPPMTANSAKEPFDSADWIFEVKLDGYRAIAVFDAGCFSVEILRRNSQLLGAVDLTFLGLLCLARRKPQF
jgi:ATP-dependent DNA ligase